MEFPCCAIQGIPRIPLYESFKRVIINLDVLGSSPSVRVISEPAVLFEPSKPVIRRLAGRA
jgi:hypothetical protein